MRKTLAILPFFLLLLVFSYADGNADKAQKKVFTFRLAGDIDPRTERHCSLALQEAQHIGADAVVMELNTFGGMLNSADSMRRMILDYPLPIVVWINKNAASAGALISLACDSIYMNDGASIGAASVVNQEGQVMPGKYQSYMRSLMRSTALANGRDPAIAEKMVYVFQDSGEVEKQVITLTTQEALDTGYCEGKARSLAEAIDLAGFGDYQQIAYQVPITETIIAFFLNPFISSILLAMMLGGIYFELQSPGIGFALAIAVLGAVFYFVPYYLNGLAANWELALLMAGFVLIALEVLVIPGFGVAGIAGLVATVAALVLAMLNNDFLDFTFVPMANILQSFMAVMTALILVVVLLFFGGMGFTKTRAFQRISLQASLGESPEEKARKNSEIMPGSIALSVGPLRPGGKIRYGDKLYEANTRGEYIADNTEVEVLGRTMNTWQVKKA